MNSVPNPQSGSRRREGVVAVIQKDAQFLVIRRSQHVVAPGKLCFPGGGIEAGETQEIALRRELQEELSVEITPQGKLWENVTRRQTRIHWWAASLCEGSTPVANPREVADIYWMTREELLENEELLDGNRDFLTQC